MSMIYWTHHLSHKIIGKGWIHLQTIRVVKITISDFPAFKIYQTLRDSEKKMYISDFCSSSSHYYLAQVIVVQTWLCRSHFQIPFLFKFWKLNNFLRNIVRMIMYFFLTSNVRIFYAAYASKMKTIFKF